MGEPRTFTARWVFPVAGPPLEHGTVTIRGDRIESVDPHGVRSPDEDLGDAAIVPGLVNPHTHLDLSGARGLIPPTDPDHFTDWLRGVIAYRRTCTPEQIQADIRTGLAECFRYGTTLIGDIASEGASWYAVSGAKTRAILFWEIIGIKSERFDAGFKDWASKTQVSWFVDDWDETMKSVQFPGSRTCRWGVSPHAPYSVNHLSAQGTLWLPGVKAIHLAESPGEMQLLREKNGPFVAFLQELGIWIPEAISLSAEEFLRFPSTIRPPHSPRLFIHCNYLPPTTPFASNQSIVYCPRTHAAFRHPTHPFREFLQRGVRVCLGTDSLASNPDLDILAEARFVHAKYPAFPGDTLLKTITLSGAEALGWSDEAGSLETGKSADFIAVPLPNREASDPHELLFADHPGDRRTMFRGEWRE